MALRFLWLAILIGASCLIMHGQGLGLRTPPFLPRNAPPPPSIVATNLAAVWHFNSSGSNLGDDGGVGFNLGFTPSASASAGHIGNAITINSGAGIEETTGDDNFDFAGGVFTISIWLRMNTPPSFLSNCDVIYKSGASDGYILRLFDDGSLALFVGTGAGFDSVTWSAPIAEDTWYQVIIGRDGDDNIYLQVNSTSTYNAPEDAVNMTFDPNSTDPFSLGKNGSGWQIMLDEMNLWDGVWLSDDQRQFLWNGGSGRAL